MPRRCIDSSLPARLLLYPQNRVFCRLSDSEFDDGFGWNLDLLLRLRIKARARFPLLLYELAKTGQDKFAVLFNRFVREVAERIEEYSSDSFVGFGGSSKCNLKFGFGSCSRHSLLHRSRGILRLQFLFLNSP